jgi:hypothetical protein
MYVINPNNIKQNDINANNNQEIDTKQNEIVPNDY